MLKTDATNEPINTLITRQQAALGLTDSQLATAIGYESGRVIGLMKAGAMRVPINKVLPLATALKLDPYTVLHAVMQKGSPELWDAVSAILAPLGPLGPTEVNLLRHLRRLCKAQGQSEFTPLVFEGRAVVALVAVP